ncbi:MAG: hypothetical protein Q4G23_00180, partial [Clostridia bacterium]|nr:hypothetical protein [Clostridia bacterium]
MKKISVCILAVVLMLCMCSCKGAGIIGGKQGSAACIECADKGLDACAGHECLACGGKGESECYICGGSGMGVYGACDFCIGGYVDCPCDDGLVYFNTPYTGGSTGGET